MYKVNGLWRSYGPRALGSALQDIYRHDIKAPLTRAAVRTIDNRLACSTAVRPEIKRLAPENVLFMCAHGPGSEGPLPNGGEPSQPKSRAALWLAGLVTASAGVVAALLDINYSIAIRLFSPLLKSFKYSTLTAWAVASNLAGGFLLGVLAARLATRSVRVEPANIVPANLQPVNSQKVINGQEGEISLTGTPLAGLSFKGRGRPVNEDALAFTATAPDARILITLADGQHGVFLPARTLETMALEFRQPSFDLPTAAVKTNLALKSDKKSRLAESEARTGLLAAVIEPDRALARLINIGLSRAYLIRNEEITLLTRDDSLAAAERGTAIERTEAYYETIRLSGEHQYIGTRIMGEEKIEPAAADLLPIEVALQANDWLVLASSGLHSLPYQTFALILAAHQNAAPQELARALKDAAAGALRDLTVAAYHHRSSEKA